MPEQQEADESAIVTAIRGNISDEFEIVELLFFAYRDFISDPDVILDEIGFGRAHHRVVHSSDAVRV